MLQAEGNFGPADKHKDVGSSDWFWTSQSVTRSWPLFQDVQKARQVLQICEQKAGGATARSDWIRKTEIPPSQDRAHGVL